MMVLGRAHLSGGSCRDLPSRVRKMAALDGAGRAVGISIARWSLYDCRRDAHPLVALIATAVGITVGFVLIDARPCC
jgi:hypothetical protein